jgi:hypothetical protein
MHAVAGHNSIPGSREADESITWSDFGVRRLWNNIGDLAVSAEQGVKRLLWELDRRSAWLGRNELNLDKAARIPVEILEPRATADQPGLDFLERVEPRLEGVFLQLLS